MKDAETILRRLSDEAEIRRVVALFADLGTKADFDHFGALWSEDGVWEIPAPFESRAQGRESIVQMFREIRSDKAYFVQFAILGRVDINGDDATATTIVQESAKGTEGTHYRNHGIFHDKLKRAADSWVFAHRRFQYLWLDTSPFGGDANPS